MYNYLIERFLKNNHNKYSKYVKEWIDNLTADQIAYFVLEKQRITDEYFIKNNNR